MSALSSDTIVDVLKNFGLTEKEVEAYILVAKRGALKGGEIAKQMKRNKGQVYRILASLQKKGLVESTLESPKRFIAVPFETALEMFVKNKRNELASIEEKTDDLLSDWKKISQTSIESPPEKFSVIEGNKKIYQKIAEMVEKTTSNLSAISTVSDLVRGEQFGIFETAYSHSLKSEIEYRILTDVNEENLKPIRLLKAKLNPTLNVKARNPDLGSALFPRMVVRDNEEILYFISPKEPKPTKKQEVCIYTNCRSLVQSFSSIFEDLWRNSTDIEQKIIEIETGKPAPKTLVIADEETAKEKYVQILRNAEEEIIMIISAKSLVQLGEGLLPFKELAKRNISVKIMAPITTENLEHAKLLSKYCEVRHPPFRCFETTIVDGKHIFRFKRALLDREESGNGFSFKNAFYSTELAYVGKTRNLLEDAWRTAYNLSEAKMHPIPRSSVGSKRRLGSKRDLKTVSERLLSAGRTPHSIGSGVCGTIEIKPPSYLKMPDIKIGVFHVDKETNRGVSSHRTSLPVADRLQVDLWLETPKGEAWVPVTIVLNTPPEVVAHEKAKWAGTLAGQNMIVVKPEELQVWKKGNTLFAGWTIPIPLLPPKYKLDPAFILFEAFGDGFHTKFSNQLPSGYLMEMEFDGFPAFTTFVGPSWKYSGPGTSGLVGNLIVVNFAPESN